AGGANVSRQIQKFVAMLQDALIGENDAARNKQLFAEQQFALVTDPLFQPVDREAAGGDVRIGNADRLHQIMFGIVEHVIVPTDIHMLVDVDPFRFHDSLISDMECRRSLPQISSAVVQWATATVSREARFASSSDALQENFTLPRS